MLMPRQFSAVLTLECGASYGKDLRGAAARQDCQLLPTLKLIFYFFQFLLIPEFADSDMMIFKWGITV